MNPYLAFGPGSEPVAWAVLGASFISAIAAWRWRRNREVGAGAARATLLLLASCAALLSAGYVTYYLRGGPRIVDAAHYYLQGRALSHGLFSFEVPGPLASFNGRFLVTAPDGTLGVLFPPGYPAALAAAFLAGAPLALGPLIGALLVGATYWAARVLGATRGVALGAASLSVLSAALRYHTADTMAHGWAALLVTITIAAAARGSRSTLVLAGLSVGWLIATRPVTGAVTVVAAGWLARSAGLRALYALPALAPGLALLLLHQRALTGDPFGSTQLAYYAAADGPPGCFRYGFGANIGCLFEHGDFVRARLSQGYGLSEALANTWRRLGVHALDITNAAPLAPFVLYGAWTGRANRGCRVACALVLGIVAAYAPFYFEGSYPGGGARFYADVIPLEHVLIARGLAALGLLRAAWPISLLGFAVHTAQQHALLRDREGGRPMFQPSAVAAAGVNRGLVFVATDHGFALGHDPGKRNAHTGIVVARRRGDALDGFVWEALGRPLAHHYAFDASSPATLPALLPIPAGLPSGDRVEFESLWPPQAVAGGWAHPDFSPDPCVSKGRGLHLKPTGRFAQLIIPRASVDWPATLIVGVSSREPPELKLSSRNDAEPLVFRPAGGLCWRSLPVGSPDESATLELIADRPVLLDYIEPGRPLADKGVDN